MDILEQHFTDQGKLLDIIDSLRSQGLGSYISLPQLVVCGDQSAGKSSVLEAISGVAFPTKDNLCTRFATEVILRRDAKISVHVTILPDGERLEEDKEELRTFQAPIDSLDKLPDLVEIAKDKMGLNHNTKAFSKDILRVELSGPNQPHLTLVDLPGLIHAESKQQTAQDVELVASLVRDYMANPRSIILAVVSAKNDYANQIVTKFAREVDPKGFRTLGVITKPDMLHVGSASETAYLELARNEDVQFRLGWHVLRNRDFDTKHLDTAGRDDAEREFFSTGAWQTLPMQCLGVESLRPRLSDVLKEQIISELPDLIRDIESGLMDCRKRLHHLGDARETVNEQRLYLVRISQTFYTLLSSATDGVYSQDFFGDARTDIGFKKRLRAVIQDLLLDYAEAMQTNGHLEHIVSDDDNTDNHANTTKHGASRRCILRSAYVEAVGELMRRTRGRELPGTFNPLIVGDLFFTQAQPWTRLAHEYMDRAISAARTTVELILDYSADASTTENLLREIINPAIERYVEQLRRKVEEVLRPHQRGHPITYNHYFTNTIQKARRDYAKKQHSQVLRSFFGNKYQYGAFDIEKLVDALNPETEGNMDRFACSEATHCMEAYYKVAMKMLVDNFAVLGVELCLLECLTIAFTAETVTRLEDDLIRRIAEENAESVTERNRTREKLRILEDGLHTLNRYRRYKHEEPEQVDLNDSTLLEREDSATDGFVQTVHEHAEEAILESSPAEEDALVRIEEGFNHVSPEAWGFLSKKKSDTKAKSAKNSVRYRAAILEEGS